MAGELAQFQALEDLKTILTDNTNWAGVAQKPNVDMITSKRVLDWMDNTAYVLLQVDDEIMRIFSHWQVGQPVEKEYAWLHTLPLTIEVHTKDEDGSTARFAEVSNRVVKILKSNVRLAGYIDLVVQKATPNSQDRIYRSLSIDCELRKMNP